MSTDVEGLITEMAFAETYIDPDGSIRTRDSLLITPSFGVIYRRDFDLGFPEVRDAAQELPENDGTYDETQYTGARTISITGVALDNAFGDQPSRYGWDPEIPWNSAAYFASRLAAFASPARRWSLYWTDRGATTSRWMPVRGAGFSAPRGMTDRYHLEWQLQLVNPTGKIFSFDPLTPDGRHRVRITYVDAESAGRSYPEVGPYDRSYPPGATGEKAAIYKGDISNGFVANIYTKGATMTNPRITVTAPDGTTSTVGLNYVAPAGVVISFDTNARTVKQSTIGGDPIVSSLDQYLAAPLQWPRLKPGYNVLASTPAERTPGYNKVNLLASSASTDAYADILYYDADLM